MEERWGLPLGMSDFEMIRNNKRIYVDKTDIICTMLEKYTRIFLSRPRRFGKSLLVSTLESLFKYGLKHFHGLKIEKHWRDERKYRVVRLDFSQIKDKMDIEGMRLAFKENLLSEFAEAGFTYVPDTMSYIEQIKNWLKNQPSDIVLLIDEYDAPLNTHFHQPEFFEQIRSMFSEFFSIVKSQDRAFRLVFITGIAKFNKASIFSTMNQLVDISQDTEFGTLLGYTEDEILTNFMPYLEKSTLNLKESIDKMLPKMREMYDGFCFDRNAITKVYAPWSVLKFLSSSYPNFANYWFESAGQPSLVMKWLQLDGTFDPFKYGEPMLVNIDDLQATYDASLSMHLGITLLLFQAGYLTIKGIFYNDVILGFPNKEVRLSMARLYSIALIGNRPISSVYPKSVPLTLATGEIAEIPKMLNLYLLKDEEIDLDKYFKFYMDVKNSMVHPEWLGVIPKNEVIKIQSKDDEMHDLYLKGPDSEV